MTEPRPIIQEFANLMESRMRVGDQRGWVWDEDEAATFDFDNLIIRAVSNLMEARTAFGNGEVYLRNISLVDAANLAMLAWNNAYASGLKDACGSRSRLGEEPMTLTDDEKHRLRDMGGACEGWVLRSQHLTPDEVADAADDCISELLALMDEWEIHRAIAALKVCGNCKHTVTPLSDMMCGAPIADDESYDWEGGYFPYVSPNDNCHYKPSYWEAYYG